MIFYEQTWQEQNSEKTNSNALKQLPKTVAGSAVSDSDRESIGYYKV